ncbi:MAG: DUF2284 domain-containing protein [Lachnospiraceae bacterium]
MPGAWNIPMCSCLQPCARFRTSEIWNRPLLIGPIIEEIARTVRDQFEAAGFETLTLSTESCAICKKCAYPDAPCRHPDKMFPCVESYGILVTTMAEQCGIEFIEGGNVVVWFSLVLLRERPQS